MGEIKQIDLGSLVGEHVLDAVDLSTEKVERWGNYFEDANVIRFRLNGVVYTAIENPEDDFRSSLDKLFVSSDDEMRNVFPPVKVIGRKKASSQWNANDTLELVDVETGKVVVEVGTDNFDDYYPMFVSAFWPENMITNSGR